MSEYIDRESLIKHLKQFAPEQYSELINQLILKEPTADVIPVVRCKDCEYHNDCSIEFTGMFGLNGFCCRGRYKHEPEKAGKAFKHILDILSEGEENNV